MMRFCSLASVHVCADFVGFNPGFEMAHMYVNSNPKFKSVHLGVPICAAARIGIRGTKLVKA